MGFWVFLGVYLITTLLSYVLRPKPPRGAPQPSSRSEFRNPTAEEGKAIPYVAGTCLIEAPNVLWYGDYETVEIVEESVTVGHRYYMGLMYGVCLGEIDRLLDVRFDQKILTVSPFDAPDSQVLVVEASSTSYPVALPSGQYATAGTWAEAVTAAIRAETGDPNVRVVYGYEIPEGATLRWQFGGGVSSAPLRAGRYSGPDLATEINRAISPTEAFAFITYDSNTGKFSLPDPGVITFRILASGTTVLAHIGFSDLADVTAPATGLETREDRFFFMVPAGVVIEWTHASTNCHALFGMEALAADFTSSSVCDNAVPSATPLAILAEFDTGTRVTFNAPDLFGGDDVEGGITGVMDIYHGGDAQIADDYLAARWGTTPPAFRGVCYAVARKLYQGTAPYLKNVSFVVERCPNGLGLTGDKHRIVIGGGALGDDANPACVIYDLLTDTRWGMGMSPSMIDLDSFRAAGETLWQEGLGISIEVEQAAEARDLLDEIRRHIDGVMYPDPETGLLTLELVRGDYNPDALPVFDEDVVRSVKVARSAWEETRNVLKVQYVDRTQNHTPRVEQIQNLANIQMLGWPAVEEIPFKGISNPTVARLVGERALRTISYPIARLELEVNRTAWRVRPAGVFRLDWPPLGISGLICRAVRVQTGEIRDNTITVEAAEDVYGLDRATFVPFS